jgi:hypothetical protein
VRRPVEHVRLDVEPVGTRLLDRRLREPEALLGRFVARW